LAFSIVRIETRQTTFQKQVLSSSSGAWIWGEKLPASGIYYMSIDMMEDIQKSTNSKNVWYKCLYGVQQPKFC
jgi:hypothetical protein